SWSAIVYTSSDAGATWNSNSAPGSLSGVACSADGTRLLAAAGSFGFKRPVLISTNFGVDWIETDTPLGAWFSVASSADGRVLLASGTYGNVFASTNFGITWAPTSLSLQAALACSA